MMWRATVLLVSLALWAALVPTVSSLTIPQALSSNMVLQRGPQQARVWGMAAPGSVLALTLDSAQYKTFADSTGAFTFDFPAQSASVDRTISITGDGRTVTFTNVAFGDVYLCSGQSNMEFSLTDSYTANTSIADSVNYPNMRLLGIQKKTSLTPLNDTINRWTDGAQWVVPAPKYVGGPSFDYFSAVCWYFGRTLYKAVNTGGAVVPIGLIDVVWGGTRVEAWTTQEGLDACGPVQSTEEYYASLTPSTEGRHRHLRYTPPQRQPRSIADVDRRWAPALSADPDPNTVKVLYNGMIAPITNMRVRGATWYQGEAKSDTHPPTTPSRSAR